MNTNRPAIANPTLEERSDRPRVKDLTFLLGFPTDPADVKLIAAGAKKFFISSEEMWIQLIRDAVAELIEAEADGRAILDKMVSDAVGQRVTVWGVNGALHTQAGHQVPGLIFQTAQVLDAAGRAVECDFANPETRRRIGAALMHFTNADWVTCTASYEVSELGFPSFDRESTC